MKSYLKLIKWDSMLVYRYGIFAVAAAVTAIYCLLLLTINTLGMEKLVAALVFSDPVMYGFLFTAVLVLFEKDANTHQALAVSPITPHQYLLSKATVFTILPMILGFLIILAAQPATFRPLLFILALILSATLFVFIGIIGVSFVNNFNQFILLMPIVLAPICLPFLDFFNLHNSLVLYIIPTQACLKLFAASIGPANVLDLSYGFIYLIIWNVTSYTLAIKLYKTRILKIDSYA